MQLFVFKKQNTGLSNLEVFVDRCNEQNLFFVCDARSKDIDSWVSAGFNVGVQMRTLNQFIQLADDMNADLLIYDNGVLKHEYTYGSAVMVSGVAKYNDADPNESPDSFTEGDMGGTVSGSGKYYPGTQAQLQVTVNEGYIFMGWFDGSDKELSDETVYTIDVEDPVTVYAKFQKQWFDVSFTKNEYIKTVTPESTRVAYGATANCTAALLDNTGEYEYTFTGWFDGDSNVGSDLTLTTPEIKSAKTFEARGDKSEVINPSRCCIYRTSRPNETIQLVSNQAYSSYIARLVDIETGDEIQSYSHMFENAGDHYVYVEFRNVTDFYGCFQGCSSLTTIPENLFSTNTQATSFYRCFNGCSSLTTIPENLFSTNTQVVSFRQCFQGCSLTTIPENLFSTNTQVTDFGSCFNGCSLTTIPENLFSTNTQVTNFGGCFQGCSLTTIPENLFSTNTQVTDFSYCFYGCSSLTTIPENLFSTNTQVTNFSYCFYRCSELMVMPKNSDGTPLYSRSSPGIGGYEIVTSYSRAFYSCTKIEGYDSIPDGWK